MSEHITQLKPRKALNKAFLKAKPNRIDIDRFKANLVRLLERSNDAESEEFHKNLVIDFLKNTYYDPKHFINTKGCNDLVIHNGDKAKSSVGVIVEAKKPTNKTEMVSTENLNKKAFQELVLYYLRERITHKNLEVKHLVITNIYEWFIFDATLFDRLFAQNKSLVKQFQNFENGRLAGSTTEFFYKNIAEPFVANIDAEIVFTYFNLCEYRNPQSKTLAAGASKADNKLIALFKLLSPEHLLKLPFANDSNSLDRRFYSELLHIIGLTETKEGNKKLIKRNKEGRRHPGSIIESAIVQLDSLDKINRLPRSGQFGSTQQERLFGVALELSITWVNRILFLKLLEAQLINYHKGDKSYAFLNLGKIKNYDDLNGLFFQVLAKKHDERDADVIQLFENVPYLNSSLFEPTDLEHQAFFISTLKNDEAIPIFPQTVLKDPQGKKRTGNISTLVYLFEFLNAYDFSSEGSEEIQEDNKTLINASVLGLIFEKINGYKDGSFFTPGFITMYMCRHTIRQAVVQKFKEYCSVHNLSGLHIINIDDVFELIPGKISRKTANEIVNSLKICDPAVGSGHFLVSALNELIAIKNDLKILEDRGGKSLHRYEVEVVNDELIVTDEEGELFEYHPASKESQRVQEALFHEKQTIIENCLFGVDINANSVKICRLRLWIELLKSAYYKDITNDESLASPVCYEGTAELREEYKAARQLETLPNIDINIKCGNSLVSRFAIDADLSQTLKKSKWTIDSYRIAVATYRHASDKAQKREMKELISDIKSNFRTSISRNSKEQKRIDSLAQKLYELTGRGLSGTGLMLFEPEEYYGKDRRLKKKREEQIEKIEAELEKRIKELEDIKGNKIYENAFEWRFEFPEVLDDEGNFTGFDVVIGNPPYIRQEEFSDLKPYLKSQYETFAGTADLFVYFVEKGLNIAKNGGRFVYILPNKWMRAGYGLNLRKWVDNYDIQSIIDFGDLPVFEEATAYPCIWFMQKQPPESHIFKSAQVDTLDFPRSLAAHIAENMIDVDRSLLTDTGWTLVDDKVQKLLEKIKNAGPPLGEYVNGKIFYGIKTGLNEAFVIDETTRQQLVDEDPGCEEIIKPFLAGRDIKRYQQPKSDKYLILFRNGQTKEMFGALTEENAWSKLQDKYPSITSHLKSYELKAKARYDKGQYWWELRACDYYQEFEKPKIMLPDISLKCEALFDEHNFYCVNTAYIIPGLSKSILGILNSKLILYFYGNLTQSIRGGYFRFIRQYLEQIPIVKTNLLEEKVNQVLSLKKQDPTADTSSLEAEIDLMVYKLYGLIWEEVKIVDPDFALSKEEYNGLNWD